MRTSPAWCRSGSADLLDGGSLYWVIKGNVQVRQRLIDIRPFTDERRHPALPAGARADARADRMAAEAAVPGLALPTTPNDAPPDLKAGRGGDDLPPALRAELASLGLM